MSKLINLPITLCVILLLSIGILVIYSSASNLALQQIIFAIVGLILYFFISQMNLQETGSLIKGAYFLILGLLILVLILGFETRGSIRWIPLGIFNIQPSEFAKPVIILLLSVFWAKSSPNWMNILKSGLILLPATILIFKQPDLGTTFTIVVIWFGLILTSKISFKKILVILVAISLLVPSFWFTLHDYQKSRITSFLSPGTDPLGVGYNLIQSTIAVGSGELLGRGLGYGTQSRLQFLPEYR